MLEGFTVAFIVFALLAGTVTVAFAAWESRRGGSPHIPLFFVGGLELSYGLLIGMGFLMKWPPFVA